MSVIFMVYFIIGQEDSTRMFSLQSVLGEWAWKAIGDRLQKPCYLSRVDHGRKIRSRKQRTDIRKYSFLNEDEMGRACSVIGG
jgi:hypothetical protein